MIFPLNHEDLRGRRYPVVTIAIIVLCFAAFLATYWSLDQESEKLARVKLHLLLLAANYPEIEVPPEIQKFVDAFREGNPAIWDRLRSQHRPIEDEFDARMRGDETFDPRAEMAALVAEYSRLTEGSVPERYAFVASKASLRTAITAAFLHAGWFHILGNMWFLWLAGTVLEDRWGRPVFAVFYLLAAVVSAYTNVLADPNSVMMGLGASGAVAGCMGAFLVRYYKTKIDFVLIYAIGFVPRFYRFAAPAWLMLPLWGLTELFWALLVGNKMGVGHWVHVGGFVFGVVFAAGMKWSGLERKMDQAIEQQVTLTADPCVVKATELIEQNRLEEAIAELQQGVQQKPDLLEGYSMLAQLYWRKQDVPAHREAMAQVVRLHLKAKDAAAAWQAYEDFVNVGGESIDPGAWVQLCRWLEGRQDWERAASEYEKFARAWPRDRMAVYALVNAARLNLKKLGRREEAARLYREAAASPVPHLDWDDAIKLGLAEATS